MKFKFLSTIFGALIFSVSGLANAGLLTENFDGAFPEWESNWLGANSNLQNFYGVGQGRGNNPDGLWIEDGLSNGVNIAEITFNSVFGITITDFSIDTKAYGSGTLFEAFDMLGNSIISTTLTSNGQYHNISFSTTNGLSIFKYSNAYIEGNTSIDNVTVTTGNVSVPEPTSLAIFALGIIGLASRRFKK